MPRLLRSAPARRCRLLAPLAVGVLAPMCGASPALATSATVQVTQAFVVNGQQVSSVALPAGGSATLLVGYSCASTTTPCRNGQISLPIPAGVSTGTVSQGSDVSSVDSVGSQQVVNMKASLPAGTTGQITVALSVPGWTTPNGSSFSWTATMAAANASAATSAGVSISASAASTTSATGSMTAGGAAGDVSSYSVSGCVTGSSTTGVGPLGVQSGSQLTVSIPAGATIIDSGGASYIDNGSGHTPTVTPAPTSTTTDTSSTSTSSSAVAAHAPAPSGGTTTPTPVPVSSVCVSHRLMLVHFHAPPGTVLAALRVTLNGATYKVLDVRARDVQIDLRGRRAGLFVVRILARTDTGRRLSTQRAYHTCRPTITGPPLPTLKLRPPGHSTRAR